MFQAVSLSLTQWKQWLQVLPLQKPSRAEVTSLSHVISLGMIRNSQHSCNKMLERSTLKKEKKSLNLLSFFFYRLNIKKINYVVNEAPPGLALPSLQQRALIFTQLIICLFTVYCPKQNFTKSTENHIVLLKA